MKARVLLAAFAASSLVVSALVAFPAIAQDETAAVVNRIVLRVNDRIATLYDYELRRSESERELLRAEVPLADRRQLAAQLPERVFADLYQEMLLLSRADQMGVVFSDEDIEQQLDAVQQRAGFTDRSELEAALGQSGLSLREFREQLGKNMRIQEVVRKEVRSRLGIDEEIARRYYRDHPERFTEPQRIQVRELIVLEREGQAADDLAALAATIRSELAAGGDLASTVATYRDRGLTSDVIDHGWITTGDLAGELEAAVWDLEPGSFSEPVASRGGLHILEVVDRREAGLRPFAEVADQVQAEATQRALMERMATYLDELEQVAYIQLDPPPGAEGFRQAAASELIDDLAGEEPEEVEWDEVAPAAEEDGPPAASDEPESPSAAWQPVVGVGVSSFTTG